MPTAAIVTLVLVALFVVAVAVTLIWVVVLLRMIHDTLGKVTFGVRAIAHRAAPLGPLIDEINGNLGPVADALEDLAGIEQRPKAVLSAGRSSPTGRPTHTQHGATSGDLTEHKDAP
jgi:hypothetical protein